MVTRRFRRVVLETLTALLHNNAQIQMCAQLRIKNFSFSSNFLKKMIIFIAINVCVGEREKEKWGISLKVFGLFVAFLLFSIFNKTYFTLFDPALRFFKKKSNYFRICKLMNKWKEEKKVNFMLWHGLY